LKRVILGLGLLTGLGCGDAATVTKTSPIEIEDSKLAFVNKALKDAGVEGTVISVVFYKGNYEAMVQPPAPPQPKAPEGGENQVGATSVMPPVSYTISQDGKVKKGL